MAKKHKVEEAVSLEGHLDQLDVAPPDPRPGEEVVRISRQLYDMLKAVEAAQHKFFHRQTIFCECGLALTYFGRGENQTLIHESGNGCRFEHRKFKAPVYFLEEL